MGLLFAINNVQCAWCIVGIQGPPTFQKLMLCHFTYMKRPTLGFVFANQKKYKNDLLLL